MSFTFRPAQRSQTKPLVGLYGVSGSGKTYSALMLARGFSGEGRVGMIDTESGRGQIYSDVIPGGYDVMTLGEPFSPDRYIEAIRAAEGAGLSALVIDSFSHEWEGLGGVLDWAGQIEAKTGKPGLHCWKDPKAAHQKLVLKLLQTPLFVVVCLRAKHKSRQIRNDRGRQEIVKDDHATPIQADDFIFELTAHAELLPDHKMRVTKLSHPTLRDIFVDGQRISIKTGRRLAGWAAGSGATSAGPPAGDADVLGRPSASPPSPDPARVADLTREGDDAADRGIDILRVFWGRLTPAEKSAVGGAAQLETWKARAEAANADPG